MTSPFGSRRVAAGRITESAASVRERGNVPRQSETLRLRVQPVGRPLDIEPSAFRDIDERSGVTGHEQITRRLPIDRALAGRGEQRGDLLEEGDDVRSHAPVCPKPQSDGYVSAPRSIVTYGVLRHRRFPPCEQRTEDVPDGVLEHLVLERTKIIDLHDDIDPAPTQGDQRDVGPHSRGVQPMRFRLQRRDGMRCTHDRTTDSRLRMSAPEGGRLVAACRFSTNRAFPRRFRCGRGAGASGS